MDTADQARLNDIQDDIAWLCPSIYFYVFVTLGCIVGIIRSWPIWQVGIVLAPLALLCAKMVYTTIRLYRELSSEREAMLRRSTFRTIP